MIPFFPVSYSTLSPDALAGYISAQYGFEIVDCRMLLRGVGDTYLVQSDDVCYIFRVYRTDHRILSQIQAEVDVLLLLRENAVSVSYPLADINGRFIQSIEAAEGRRHAVLFSFAPGHSVSKLGSGQLRSLGREMARFHSVVAEPMPMAARSGAAASAAGSWAGGDRWSAAGRWTLDLETTLFGPLRHLEPFFNEDPAGYVWLQEAAHQVEKRMAATDTSTFSTGICQFDFLPKNFHFENESVTFFDFDFMGFGWHANDIMTFWQHQMIDVHFGRVSQIDADKAFSEFLESYREIRSFSRAEQEAIPYLSLGFWLFYIRFHTTHDQFYPFIQPDHLKLRVGLIQALMKKYWSEPFPAPAC